MLASVPGFDGQAAPNAGAKWHVASQCWVDTRTNEERKLQAAEDLAAARRAAYPPLADLADALYWQMQRMIQKCANPWRAAMKSRNLLQKPTQCHKPP